MLEILGIRVGVDEGGASDSEDEDAVAMLVAPRRSLGNGRHPYYEDPEEVESSEAGYNHHYLAKRSGTFDRVDSILTRFPT